MCVKEIEFVVRKCPTRKTSCPESFIVKLHQAFKEEKISIVHILIQKIEEERVFPILFY